MKNIKFLPLSISLVLPFIAGGIGSYFTAPAITTWYATLEKPFFNPPNWIFGPVWTLLYIFMGISFYLVWTTHTKKPERVFGIRLFMIQLAVNTLWSIIFFGLQSPSLALLVIIILWILIFLTIKNFLKISKPASWLLIPYLAWVSFAALLNIAITLLN